MSDFSISPSGVNYYNVFVPSLSGKMELPVMESQSLYANFTYVQGVPSSEGGLSLDRLKVIDSLIGQINAHRQVGTEKVQASDFDLSNPDEAIVQLSQQAHQLQSSDATGYRAWTPPSGLIFNFHA